MNQRERPPVAELLAIRVIRSDDRYPPEDAPPPIAREATAGPWKISVHFGPIPANVAHLIAIYSTGRNFILDYIFGNPGRPGITMAEHLENRDKEIDTAVAQYSLEEDWTDPASLYITVIARREIPMPIDVNEHHPRHFWVPDDASKRTIEKYKDEAEAMIGFGIARSTIGPPYRHSGMTHSGCPRYVVILSDREPCPLTYMTSSAKGQVGRGTWNDTIERFRDQNFELASTVKLSDYKTIGQIGIWHLAAYNEPDTFRRFMWSYIGLEVICGAVANADRDDLTETLGSTSDLGHDVIKELLWPPGSADGDPNRSIRFRFALFASLLSPETATEDVAQFGKLNHHRNNIHGRLLPSSEPPAIEAFTLFEKYAILAAEYLAGDAPEDKGGLSAPSST